MSASERILDTAEELFYREGIRAVGIDTIIEKSGVAKMSLYRSFASKDELVAAYLQRRSRRYWEWWDRTVGQHPDDARQQLRDVFAGLIERTRRPGYRGCAFLNAAVEFPGETSRARAAALAHKAEMRRRLLRLCRAAGARRHRALALQLQILIEGMASTAGALGRRRAATAAGQAAYVLIGAATQKL